MMILGEDNLWRSKASTSTTKSNDKIILDGYDKSSECNDYLLMIMIILLLILIYDINYRFTDKLFKRNKSSRETSKKYV